MALTDEIVAERTDRSGGCWVWLGHLNESGYSRYGGQNVHRWMYERHVGPISDGLHIDHLCRVRNCVNPDHLEPVTKRENTLRGDTLAARKAAQTHCVHGHEFTPENIYRHPQRGTRHCRTCMTLHNRSRHRQVRAGRTAA